jgi:hypothetical protein
MRTSNFPLKLVLQGSKTEGTSIFWLYTILYTATSSRKSKNVCTKTILHISPLRESLDTFRIFLGVGTRIFSLILQNILIIAVISRSYGIRHIIGQRLLNDL